MSGTLADLRGIDLFDDLTDAQLQPWADAARPFTVAPGDSFIEHDAAIPGLVLLLEGDALTQTVAEDGHAEVVGVQHAPTWMGAIAVLTGGPMAVRVSAEGACRLALIPAEAFITLALANRSVHQRIMHQVGPVLNNLRAVEANRERLTSLGTMAAGLAHELNNPAAAAKRAASSLVEALETVNGALATFVEGGVERADAERLLDLQREALQRCAARDRLSGVAAADAEDATLELLERLDVAEPWTLAESLSFLDEDWLRRVHAIAGPLTGNALHWVAASVAARTLATELLDSTSRMSTLVGAVKTYSYMDRGGLVELDVHDGLDSTLTMLGHKLKHTRIAVVRDYDRSLPRLTVHGSELNQVWTNLLDNAIQALGEQGTITLRTRLDGPCVLVDVVDDGPGIPAAAREHLFDPFFTTKPVGQGTGLGLDTARRIVEERHRGTLGFDSGTDGTTFHVWLPIEETAR